LVVLITICFNICGFYYINKRMTEIEASLIEREGIFQDWLFNSLYSINNKVLLPEEIAPIESDLAAVVVAPEDDPMYQFHGSNF